MPGYIMLYSSKGCKLSCLRNFFNIRVNLINLLIVALYYFAPLFHEYYLKRKKVLGWYDDHELNYVSAFEYFFLRFSNVCFFFEKKKVPVSSSFCKHVEYVYFKYSVKVCIIKEFFSMKKREDD